jgi:HK97 family phage prohead protease
MPTPRAGESREAWMERCIPEVIAEGNDEDQAVAICASMYQERSMTETQKTLTVGLDLKQFNDDSGEFQGYASVFNTVDADGDVIVPGAFKQTIQEHQERGTMPKMLWQHDFREIVGKFTEMSEDENGLMVTGHFITDVAKGREAYALMKAGVLDSMSVGFNIVDAGPGESRSMGRVIQNVDLWEVSLVTWGANPDAKVTNVKARQGIREFETFLRDAGFSRKEAKAVAADGFKALDSQRDAGESESDDDELTKAILSLTETIKEASNG